MHKFRFLPFSIAMALLLFWGAAAHAHLCFLPKGTGAENSQVYSNQAWGATTLTLSTLSSPTYEICSAADAADGTVDGTINIEWAPGDGTAATDLKLDVVYGQATETINLIFSFSEKYKYDSTISPKLPHDPSACTCTPKVIPLDPEDPEEYGCVEPEFCTDYPKVTPNKTGTGFSKDNTIALLNVTDRYVWTGEGNFAPLKNINFRLDTVEFKNTYADTEHADFEFNTIDVVKTSILSYKGSEEPPDCELLYAACPGTTGTARQQTAYKLKVTFTTPPCFTGKPGAASLTCPGQPGCTQTAGPAISTLNFTLPSTASGKTGCYESDGTTVHTPCADLKVKFVPPVAGGAAVTKDQSQSPFTEDTTIEGTPTVGPVTIIGTSSSCADSNLGTGTYLGSVTAAAANCQCGAPPVVALSKPTETQLPNTKYAENSNINLEFTVTLDPGADPPLSCPEDVEEIVFYYTNDPGATSLQTYNPLPSLNSSCKFTAIIDKAFVVEGAPIWFGVILRDSNLQYGYYPGEPTPLDIEDANDVAGIMDPDTGGFEIEVDQIFAGTQCDFVTRSDNSKDPYPSQFPYQAGSQVLRIYFQVNDTANVSARIYMLDGTLIRHLDSNNAMGISSDNIDCSVSECNFCNDGSSKQQDDSGCIWDGTNYQGGNHTVANGMYIVNIHAVCTDKFSGGVIDFTKGIVVMK